MAETRTPRDLFLFGGRRTPGDLFLFGGRKPCETEGCERETAGAIWDGEHWRRTCDAHQPAFHNKLRRRGLRPSP